jgi:NADPH:quinone reductase-like Zn-dependent oxidoreductase
MRAYVVHPPFGRAALRQVERPVPAPGPGQVLVRMRAVSLNYRDLLVIDGTWAPVEPRIPVSDGVGEVVALGAGATRARIGDRVAGIFLPDWTDGPLTADALRTPSLGGTRTDGVLAEYVAFDERAIVHVPPHLTDVEAATVPLAGVTAWHALIERGRVTADDTVLVQGTGGVSLFALQIARQRGARVLVTSSSDEKLARARALGAADGINYRTTDWAARALELTNGRGVDLVLETVGGDDVTRALEAVRVGGTIAMVGRLGATTTATIDLFGFVEKNVRFDGVLSGSRAMLEALLAEMAAHAMRPVVDRVFAWDDLPAALDHLARGAHFGKVCVRVDPAA